jgi:hypothetical protein
LKAISAAITALGFALCATGRIIIRGCAAQPAKTKVVRKSAERALVRIIPGS